MSRCFPYPPPGYAGKCASNEALIWTIKLQRESEKPKSEKPKSEKPKSEKKKDRRKEKKEKKKDDKMNGTITSSEKKEKKIEDKSNGNISMGKKTLTDGKLHHGVKQQQTSNEHMEKSTVTEEHGRPCSSSDSTENSGKRKRQSPPAGNNAPRNPGTVIRLVLNSRKKDDGPTSSVSAAPITTIGSQKANVAAVVNSSAMNLHITPPKSNNISMASVLQKADAVVKSSDPKVHIAPPMSNATQQVISSSNKGKEVLCPVAKGIEQKTSVPKEEKLPRPLRKYKALFESWVPSSMMEIDTVNDGDDEDWLFGSKKECNSDKRMKCCKEEVPSYDKPAYQPIAHFLSDADIYALPFTVPF